MLIEEIHRICLKYNIKNYTINEDLSIDVDGYVDLCDGNLNEFPLRFRNVTGWFNCSYNELISLNGSPSSVGKYFSCANNNLKSLEGAPSSVDGYFYCYDNPLESLKGITSGIKSEYLNLPLNYTYNDYLAYFRNLKFKKFLK